MNMLREITDEEPGLGSWAILHGYRGSVAHGMYEPPENPLSIDDKDTMAVCVPSLDYYYGLSEYGSHLPAAQARAVRPIATWIGSSGGVSPALTIASTLARVSAR